LTDMWN